MAIIRSLERKTHNIINIWGGVSRYNVLYTTLFTNKIPIKRKNSPGQIITTSLIPQTKCHKTHTP